MPETPVFSSPEPPPIRSVWILGARITWILVGPLLTAAVTYAIVVSGRGWLTGWDALYAGLVALMILGRWVEFRSGTATTATGEPATVEHARRYTRVVVPTAACVWIAANVLGNHVLG